MKRLPTAFLILILSLQFSFGQSKSALETDFVQLAIVEQMESVHLSETRILNMYLPFGYHPDSVATYPVIYLLDGSAHEDFVHIVGLVQFMNMYELMPQSIVVGISNVDRYRDFTHPTTESEDLKALPTGGGSKAFLDFLEFEAQPFVEKYYKSNGHRTIIGQSMGGLLASEVLLTRPHLFEDYIIVSPSLWWDNQSLINKSGELLEAMPDQEKKVFVSLGTEHPVMHEVADKLVAAIKNSDQEKMIVFYEPILEENHATILHKAVYKAFEKLNEKEE